MGLILFSLSGCLPAVETTWEAGPGAAEPTHDFLGGEAPGTPEVDRSLQFEPAVVSTSQAQVAATATPVYFTPTPPHVTAPELNPQLQFCSPLEDHSLVDLQEIISFPYDPPPPGKDTGHHGVDFAYYRRGERLSILGVPVQSVLPGKVAAANQNLVPYGYMVIVETSFDQLPVNVTEHLGIPAQQSLYLLYAHMNEPPLAELGNQVACGQTLGYVGNTPENWSSAPHLHFEARFGPPGGQFSGMQFYDKRSQPDQMEKYTLWRMSGDYVLLDPLALLVYGLGLHVDVGN